MQHLSPITHICPGVVILMHTLKKQGSKQPLVVLYTPELKRAAVTALQLEAAKSNMIL
ncbi:hypothetical protein B0I35DRAFT_431252 [Stachybotrys elegans]|uniref:Uncharacterized protein n=1 Tax=Stachybotrys elegans TaxID=80388 RepID=A0A8K0WS31_9HYPO|nr:hypothetical protein B0I35DRAFT_431252 [Stachybotrys elegans]